MPVLDSNFVELFRKKSSQSKVIAGSKNQSETVTPVSLEVQTHLPLRTQDTARTEYVAPVRKVQYALLHIVFRGALFKHYVCEQ